MLGGTSLVTIFVPRGAMARRRGLGAFKRPTFGGFELEDILYAIAPLTWLGWLEPFLVCVAIGTPLFALWCAWRLRRLRSGLDPAPSDRHISMSRGMGQDAGGQTPDVANRRE